MIRRFVLVALIVAAFALISVNARLLADGNPIEYGKTVSGEISDKAKEARYEFAASKGDIAVVQVLPGVEKTLYGAYIKLEDKNGKTLADSAALIVFGRLGEIIAAEITADGTYAITVYVDKDWKADDAGTFDLTLLKAEALEVGKSVQGQAESTPKGKRASYSAVYALSSTDDVMLNYAKDKGSYSPSVIVFSLETGNNLYPLSYMGGRALSGGSLKVDGDRNFRIVAVGSLNYGDQSSSDKAESASFTLSIAAPSK